MHRTVLLTPADPGFDMTSTASPFCPPSVRASKLLVALLGAATAIYASPHAVAQDVTATAVAHTDLTAMSQSSSFPPFSATIPAGTNVTSGASITHGSAYLRVLPISIAPYEVVHEMSSGTNLVATFGPNSSPVFGEWANGSSGGQTMLTLSSVFAVSGTLHVTFTLSEGVQGIGYGGGYATGVASVDIGADGSAEFSASTTSSLAIPLAFGPGAVLVRTDLATSSQVFAPYPGSFGQAWTHGVLSLRYVPDQSCAITNYGSSCGAIGLAVEEAFTGAHDFLLSGIAPGAAGGLLFGFSQTQLTVPVPPGCTLWVSPDIGVAIPITGGTGAVRLALAPRPITFNVQAVEFDIGAGTVALSEPKHIVCPR